MSRPRRDTDLTVVPHRDAGSSPSPSETMRGRVADPDAPAAASHEDYSGQVLASAFRSVEPGSDAERALIAVVDLLASKERDIMADHSKGGDGNGGNMGGITRAFATKVVAVLFTGITVVQPTTAEVAALALSPTTALERKLDDVLAQQATLAQQSANDRATFIALAKWTVSCEIARKNGLPMPEPPAAVQLILVQDELARSTGP